MAKYIDADKLLNHLKENLEFCPAIVEVAIKNASAADVAEVKHGKWFLLDDCSNAGVYCSVCRKKVYMEKYANQKLLSNYCPHCGAKMDGGNDV